LGVQPAKGLRGAARGASMGNQRKDATSKMFAPVGHSAAVAFDAQGTVLHLEAVAASAFTGARAARCARSARHLCGATDPWKLRAA
jgi:hypothetical protein